MNKNNKRRLSAGSTPVPSTNKSGIDINASIENNSPIATPAISKATKRRLSFDPVSESDSDSEIIFTKQANKRKKMSEKDEMKVWFKEQFGDKLDKLDFLATSAQVTALHEELSKNSAKTEKNAV